MGRGDSIFRAYHSYMIELLSNDPDFPKAHEKLCETDINHHNFDVVNSPGNSHADAQVTCEEQDRRGARSRRNQARSLRSGLLLATPEPWTNPSEDELKQIDSILGPFWFECNISEHVKRRFSAAAAAINFLKSVSQLIVSV